jgi:2-C-methyl-D-erythritol 4-phosphate cytidylyltransferase
MASFAVILPAAGQSSRFKKGNRKKTFTELKGRAVWLRAAEPFLNRKDVVQTIVVVATDDLEWFREKFRPNLAFMDIEIVEGGSTRAESVRNGLAQVKPEAEFVAIHDAARPLIAAEWIGQIFQAAQEYGAAIPAVPVTSTLKRVGDDQFIEETVPRENLWVAQTPQVFGKQMLVDAYESPGAAEATDEASLMEMVGQTVKVVEGSPINIKITTNADFRMAESLLHAVPKDSGPRSLHPFKDDDGLLF